LEHVFKPAFAINPQARREARLREALDRTTAVTLERVAAVSLPRVRFVERVPLPDMLDGDKAYALSGLLVLLRAQHAQVWATPSPVPALRK
jgi:hypothetical protein